MQTIIAPRRATTSTDTPAEQPRSYVDVDADIASIDQDPIIVRALDFISENLERKISLDELASRAGCDKFRMIRVFRRIVGTTPHAYLVEARVKRAAELLKAGEPAAEVAFCVGFVDQSHLIRFFKRHAGTTPKRFLLCAPEAAILMSPANSSKLLSASTS